MRYNELVKELQNLTNEVIKPYDMSLATGKSTSTFTYKRDNNGIFTEDDISKIFSYVKKKLNNNETYELDYYPEVYGSCGNGSFAFSGEKQKITVSQSALFSKLSKVKKYSVINAVSDSMMPDIMPKDLLIVQHYDNEPIKDNHIYIFSFENALFCKYLSNNLGQIIVRSRNELYPIRFIEKNDLENFKIIGEVIGHIRNYNSN